MIRPLPIIATSILGGVVLYYAGLAMYLVNRPDYVPPITVIFSEWPSCYTIAVLSALVGWTFWARSVWRKWRAEQERNATC